MLQRVALQHWVQLECLQQLVLQLLMIQAMKQLQHLCRLNPLM
jgi:hypothetical protein